MPNRLQLHDRLRKILSRHPYGFRTEKSCCQWIFRAYPVAGIDSKFFHDRYNDYLNIGANAVVLFDNSGAVLTGWFKKNKD